MMTASRHLGLALVCSSLVLIFAPNVAAQPPEPIGPFVVDARGVFVRFKDDPVLAETLAVATADMPSRGLGLNLGAHFYPVRGKVALGVGAEILFAGGSQTNEPDDEDPPTTVVAPTVSTRLRTFSPQVSLNFGTGRGWSYLTGGWGWASYRTERDDDPVAPGESTPKVFNYGGGARWFAKPHLAFAVDLRFYNIGAQEAVTGRPAYPSMTLMVVSAGIAFK
jgi:hypothetical protein